VAVYFQYDEFGSRKLRREFLDDLRAAGVHVTAFGANRGPGNRFQLNFRNHRKILVIDGECAFVGGLNLGDKYLGRFAGLDPWRDTHLRIRGAAARDLQHVFVEDWFWATREIPELCWDCGEAVGECDVVVVPTGPADPVESCQLLFVNAIHSAEERIWIASPYFVPDGAVIAALQSAALRGVDVRVMLPSNPDHLLVFLSSFAYYPDMFECGVRIFRYQEGFLHQKVFLVDRAVAAVGTANLDNRSFRLNFEVTALVADGRFVREVEEMMEADFRGCVEVGLEDYTGRPLWFRVACRLSRLVSPLQ
jgi:cardiolipin synthase